MTTDVVIVAYRSGDHLRPAVERLCGANGIRVIVVDNACPDDSTAAVADLPVEIVRMGRNAGFAAGCNAGAARGSGDTVLFLNPDATISPEDVRLLASRIEGDPACGAVAPRIFKDDGEVEWTMGRAPSLRAAFGQALYLHHFVRRSAWPTEFVRTGYDEATDPEWVIGAALCVRRSAFEELGGFDERFFLYSEDIDICVRLRRAGHRLLYEPAASAHHVGGGSGSRATLAPLNANARVTYVRLHARGLRYVGFRIAYALHELLRIPLAAVSSRQDLRARLRALRVTLGDPTRGSELVPSPGRLSGPDA